jgi:hypothetical protein
MELSSKARTRIARLHEEMDGIHFVNSLYWERGEVVTRKGRADYQRRLKRLKAIRAELAQLRAA